MYKSLVSLFQNKKKKKNNRNYLRDEMNWMDTLDRTCKGAPLLNQFMGPITPAEQTRPIVGDFVQPFLAMATFPNPYR